ncbi:macro domain-containing protein [Myroides sp. NP-2]|uniref:macro domain-containing protein n=1 Tax=Myroides sp. NP-2 TaxID=2759945 RepID=UPI0015FDB4A9|nr:macro domain-containing protein [Myroides sp. NP-2]MBB1150683.1 macro domain-containing protein [Myroides sp. NP-2]
MVTYIEQGNIFNLEDIQNYAHGCNCAGAMGNGIALQFKNKFPKMYIEYKKLCKENLFSLGDIYTYTYNNETIFNLGTQATWKTKADINAIESSLIKMLSYAQQNNIYKIALPKIGAGLGGLNWNDVKSIIDKVSLDYQNINLFVVENYKEV